VCWELSFGECRLRSCYCCAVTTAVKPVCEAPRPEVAGRSVRARKLNAKGESRLHIAARLNKTSDVITLLMEGADINARDYAGL